MKLFDGIEKAGRGPKATQKQRDFIEQLCDQLQYYDPIATLDELTIGEASDLIEELLEERDQDPDYSDRPMFSDEWSSWRRGE